MTHEELQDAINVQIINAPPFALGGYTRFLHGLSAVVELHKPEIIPGCGSDTCFHCEKDGERYPCETIRFIEKEF